MLRCAASSVSTSSSCSATYHSSSFLGHLCRHFNHMLSSPVVFRIFVALHLPMCIFRKLVHRTLTLVISTHTTRSLTSFALVHELFIALSETLSIFFCSSHHDDELQWDRESFFVWVVQHGSKLIMMSVNRVSEFGKRLSCRLLRCHRHLLARSFLRLLMTFVGC